MGDKMNEVEEWQNIPGHRLVCNLVFITFISF